MSKLLIITGSTASGKTELGIDLAKKYDGEIVSADSRQVYKGMDIGTGKDIPSSSGFHPLKTDTNFSVGFRMKDSIPIWLVDIVPPDFQFNLGDYKRLANLVIQDIWSRNKLAIVVGGTGLYIKSLVMPLDNISIPPDLKLRQELNNLPLTKLQQMLKENGFKKWELMNYSDRQNPRRLIRALEISGNQHKEEKTKLNTDWLMVYLFSNLSALYEKIDSRVEKRIKQGIVIEIDKLQKKGYSFDLPSLSAFGYKLFKPYFKKGISTEDLKTVTKKWKFEEHAFVRRQITWFKKMLSQLPKTQIIKSDINDKNYYSKIVDEVSKWYTSNTNAKKD